jgi:hypothetical protein
MAAPCYITWNAVTSAMAGIISGQSTAAAAGTTKTMLQLAPFKKIRIVEWGYHFVSAPTAPVIMELIETGTVFGTVTPGSIGNYNDATGDASQATIGTAATGFQATAEGAVVATRLLAESMDLGTLFKQQFPLGREPEVVGGRCLRIRATPMASAVTSLNCYIIWEE